MRKCLLYGYGNPGRLDDGLGPALAERVKLLSMPGVDVDANYQLQVEDAYDISQYDTVIFADACVDHHEAFYFKELQPVEPMSFSSHSVAPQAVLHLARNMFQSDVKAYILGIRGYVFNDFGEGISDPALQNLNAAYQFVTDFLAKD